MVTEQAGKAAVGFVDAMKTQPLSLALVVMNFALIGFIYMQATQFTDQRRENVKLFIDVQREVQALLAKCVIPAPGQSRSSLPTLPLPPITVPISTPPESKP